MSGQLLSVVVPVPFDEFLSSFFDRSTGAKAYTTHQGVKVSRDSSDVAGLYR